MEALCRYFNGCVAALAALFSPVVPLVWCVVGFISFDFLTGVLASRAEARREGREWWFTSAQAWHTAQKLGLTIIALCMAYLIDTEMLDFMHLNLTKLFAGFVCGVEMWSFLENACRISDAPMLDYLRRWVGAKLREEVYREPRNKKL